MSFTIGPRIHFFEIDDQAWFPQFLRTKVQACLTYLWKCRVPIISPNSASSALSNVFFKTLGTSLSSYTFVDFCAGAGGPTPIIERMINQKLRQDEEPEVTFVLTDYYPNPEAWKTLAAKSEGRISWVGTSVDAGKAPPKEVLIGKEEGGIKKKVFRMFSLAFHHFDDEGAGRIARDAILNSDGFGIFEMQSRTPVGFFQVFSIGPILTFSTILHKPFRNFGHLFWTYIIPVLPFILVWDGYISSLRTRTHGEVMAIVNKATTEEERQGWRFISGQEIFVWPMRVHYVIGVKDATGS